MSEKKTVLESFVELKDVVANSNSANQEELMNFLDKRISLEEDRRKKAKDKPKKPSKADAAVVARRDAVAALLTDTPVTSSAIAEKTGFTIGQCSSALVALVKAGKAAKGETVKNHNTYVIAK